MKLRKHKNKLFLLRYLRKGSRVYRTEARYGNDAPSIRKAFLFGQDEGDFHSVRVIRAAVNRKTGLATPHPEDF